MQAHLHFVLAHGEAREVLFDDERADAVVALGLIGHGEDNEDIRHITVGDEDLGTVQDVVISF